MATEIQKTGTQSLTTLISKTNWQESWGTLPVKAGSSATEVLGLNTPQLCKLGKDVDGDMVGIVVFQVQIGSFIEYMDLKWSDNQILECGKLAYDEYYWLSLAELKQFFLRAKTGRYTSNKNISPAILMEFLNDYGNEMHAERGSINAYAWRQRKEKPVLSIDHLKGRNKEIALEMVAWVKEREDYKMAVLKKLAMSFSAEDNKQQEREQEKARQQESKQQAAEKLRKLGVPDDFINQFWKK